MGMTIDKAILRVEHSSMSVDDKETTDFIIDTMRKYQKIEQILNEDFKAYHPLDRNPYRLSLIREVVEE